MDKKKIVLMACVLGVDVVQTLERAGLGMDWLTDVGSPGEMLDDLISYENPLETYWENMSTLFEDGVKGALLCSLSVALSSDILIKKRCQECGGHSRAEHVVSGKLPAGCRGVAAFGWICLTLCQSDCFIMGGKVAHSMHPLLEE